MTRPQPPQESKAIIRCAVYTRKSSDEGLDQDFNSLDAQREAAEAFIASQKAEGWVCLPTMYDDGGFTGGNMERPALRRLLADIDAGKIDAVVVYKVDRLSRSLLDFARIMETFDGRQIAFVSVTQQFNTSTPMGRLVLNVLLSFAQFEREIIGERIRDKIAAQRRRGKWAGGYPVLGYDVDRTNPSPKLVVNADEAARVRAIFGLYLELGSLLPVVDELARRDWRNKHWHTKKGTPRGDRPFDKGSLHALLTNAIYIGKVKHKHQRFDGEHEPIVDEPVFRKAQRQLQTNGHGAQVRNRYGALLRGLLHCQACGRTMVHTFANRDAKRYRYYTCTHALQAGRDKCPSGSVPAAEIERIVVDEIRTIAGDAALRNDVFRQAESHIEARLDELSTQQKQLKQELKRHHAEIGQLAAAADRTNIARMADLNEAIVRADNRLADVRAEFETTTAQRLTEDDVDVAFADFDNVWNALSPREQAQTLSLLVASVTFDADAGTIGVSFHDAGIKALGQGQLGAAA